MMVPIVATAIRALWVIAEYLNQRRFRAEPRQEWDRHSAKLWDAANAIEPIGMILGFIGFGQIQIGRGVISAFGLVLLLAGIGIRWTAIHHLGKYFTGKVVIKDGHQLVQSGPYKHLRHPAYSGALLAHLGLGLSFSNWFSLCLSVLPFIVDRRTHESALKVIWFVSIRVIPFRDISWIVLYSHPRELQRT